MPIPSWLTLKLGAIIFGALALPVFFGLAIHWKHQAADRGEKLATICQAARDASGQPKLKCGEVPKQIQFMGQAIGTLTTALNKQSAAVAQLGSETKRQQAEAVEASRNAQARARGAEATSERLAASSRSTVPQRACEPSKTLQDNWH